MSHLVITHCCDDRTKFGGQALRIRLTRPVYDNIIVYMDVHVQCKHKITSSTHYEGGKLSECCVSTELLLLLIAATIALNLEGRR